MGTNRRGSIAEPSTVLFGQTRRRVLAWLLGHADESYYLRQIVRLTGAAQGAVQRELSALSSAGLITRTVQGRQVYFRANRESPIFPELQSLLMKTAGLVDVLRESLAPLDIAAAFVFGSAARGELRADSDIDLLVVSDVPFEDVAGALAVAQQRIGRDVNPAVYPLREFQAKLKAGQHFVTNVMRQPHVFVIGEADELGRLGTQRVGDRAPRERLRSSGPARGRRTRPRG